MKIAVLGTRGFPHIQGGVEAHCENLYPYLVKMGCEVKVFTRKPYGDPNINSYKGITLIPLPCPRKKSLEAFLHTLIGIFAVKMFSPDILHIHAIGPSLFIPIARLLGLKVVMTHHGPDYQRKKWGKLARLTLKLGERFGCTWANDVVCISETIAVHVREKYHRDVTVIPNGVAIPEILQSDDTLKKYALTKGRYILSVGRFVPEKGFHDLIDAFNQFSPNTFKPQIPATELPAGNWKQVIVGSADHEDAYSLSLKEKAKNNNNIILTGFLTGKPLHELYSHAGLFVLPSYYEGLPIVLLEAMSYGLSCIASDIPANRNVEISKDRFFQAGNIPALAAKMKEYIDKPLNEAEKRKQITMISQRYNWGEIAERTLKVYKNAPALPVTIPLR